MTDVHNVDHEARRGCGDTEEVINNVHIPHPGAEQQVDVHARYLGDYAQCFITFFSSEHLRTVLFLSATVRIVLSLGLYPGVVSIVDIPDYSCPRV